MSTSGDYQQVDYPHDGRPFALGRPKVLDEQHEHEGCNYYAAVLLDSMNRRIWFCNKCGSMGLLERKQSGS